MIVESQAVGPFFKNGFVVGCEETREAVLIDPGDESIVATVTTNHLESIWRDSKVGEIYEGANEVQLWSIARVALGRDLTG